MIQRSHIFTHGAASPSGAILLQNYKAFSNWELHAGIILPILLLFVSSYGIPPHEYYLFTPLSFSPEGCWHHTISHSSRGDSENKLLWHQSCVHRAPASDKAPRWVWLEARLQCFWQDLGPPGSGLIYRPPAAPARPHWPPPCLHPAGCPAPWGPSTHCPGPWCCLSTCYLHIWLFLLFPILAQRFPSQEALELLCAQHRGSSLRSPSPTSPAPCPPLAQPSGAAPPVHQHTPTPTTVCPPPRKSPDPGTHSVFLLLCPLQISPFLPWIAPSKTHIS